MAIVILILLLLSWIFLHLFTKNNLSILGFTPVRKRLFQLIIGFFIYGLICASLQFIDSLLFSHIEWKLNPEITINDIFALLWWDTKSVLFEELLFRGALLYILVQKLGARNGIILSSLCFGIYHWYTYGVFGNVTIMAFVLIMTAIPGLVFAYAFVKTKSMALAIGLHLGWNFTNNSIFANGSWSDYHILIPQVPQTGIETMPHLVGIPINYLVNVLLANIMLPLLTYLVLKYYYLQSKDK